MFVLCFLGNSTEIPKGETATDTVLRSSEDENKITAIEQSPDRQLGKIYITAPYEPMAHSPTF